MGRIIAKTLAELFQKAGEKYAKLPAFATRDKSGKFHPVDFVTVYETGLNLATALIDMGVEAKQHIGLLADNRLEWIICDYGVILAGAADVPRGTDVTESEIIHILSHADARVTFVENLSTFEKLRRGLPMLEGLETIIIMDRATAAPPGTLKLEDLISKGAELRAGGDRRAEQRMANIVPEDLFTIIYTSGTTGTPKGVQLTHANMCSQVRNLPFDLDPGDRALSILPIWHSYERIFEMVAIGMGACTYYTSLRTIGEDLKTVRPTVMASAPRLWESLYQKLISRMASASTPKQVLFNAARTATSRVKRAERFFLGQELDVHKRGRTENLSLSLRHGVNWILWLIPCQLLDKIVLSKLREAMGCGEFRGTISGGGALQPHVDEFFNFIGIPVLEGYGLTETSPVLAVRTWKNLVIGTVGPPYPETEIRIIDLENGEILYPNPKKPNCGIGLRGEIHASGPQIMKGYYKSPESTARVLKEGWLNTGDIGMVTFNGCLKILGRSKDTIVLLSGENVEPVPIECRLVHSPLIEHCMVVGQDQKVLGALIVPALDGFRAAGVPLNSENEVARSEEACRLLDADVRRLVSADFGFKPFERIAHWRIVNKPFAVRDEMTNTYKLKRHVITSRYTSLIAEMYPEP